MPERGLLARGHAGGIGPGEGVRDHALRLVHGLREADGVADQAQQRRVGGAVDRGESLERLLRGVVLGDRVDHGPVPDLRTGTGPAAAENRTSNRADPVAAVVVGPEPDVPRAGRGAGTERPEPDVVVPLLGPLALLAGRDQERDRVPVFELVLAHDPEPVDGHLGHPGRAPR